MATYRKFIFVCNGGDCKDEGCKKLTKDLKSLIQTDGHKGKYKIIRTKCMDFCKSAPVVVYNNEVCKKADVEAIRQKLTG
ncbi:MAG: NAD(P)H-dependent oxidoreductase subunit E [Nitritalea sp.]